MRTDDFDGPKSQDAEDNRPDVLAADEDAALGRDHDGDGFNEFDSPLPGQKSSGSLAEIWRNNPILKLGIIGVGVIAVVAALIMFGGGSKDNDQSRVGNAIKQNEAPGNDTTEAYRDAINEVNQQRLDQALQTGQSTMPIPVSTDPTSTQQGGMDSPPVDLADPLAGWRSGNQQTGPEATLSPDSPQLTGGMPGQGQQQQQLMPQGPDPAAVDALASAMNQQMASILEKHAIKGAQIISVTQKDYYSAKSDGTGAGAGGSEDVEVKEILIPAGTIVYAQTLTESNTDAPGPVLVRLSSGPLTGSRMLGTFNNTEDYLILEFNTIVVNGVSQAINAVALDPKTTLPAVATEVDRRYWRRVLLPAAARFIEGMGDAVAQREQTIVMNDNSTVSTTPDLNTREELAAGLAEGTQELADELDREGDRTKIMIKVHAGTPVGILFLEPVLKEDQ